VHTTSSVLIRELVERLEAAGLSRGAIEVQVGAQVPAWGDPDARWPLTSFAALTRLATDELGDPALGLHVAETLPAERQHVVARIVQSAGTFREAAAAWARYASLVSTADRLRPEDRGARFRLCYAPLADAPAVPFLHEHYLVLSRRLLALLGAGEANVSFELATRAPPYAAEVHRVLGPSVRFGATSTAVELDAAAADAPLPHADPYLGAVLRVAADHWLGGVAPPAAAVTVGAQVLDALDALDALDGAALRGRIADALDLSEKSLQRRLQQEGVTFKELLDRHRRARALAWIADGKPTVEVAWRLGFSEIAAFTRAFRRWSGSTVVHYRRATRSGALPTRAPRRG